MKKLLIILLFFYSGAHSQFHFGMGAGSDFKYGIANVNAGYETNNYVVFETEMQPSLTRDAAAHNYFGCKAGYDFGIIVPSVGYYYDYRSADNARLNKWHAGYSLKIVALLTEHGGLFTNIMYIHKQVNFTAGVHFEL